MLPLLEGLTTLVTDVVPLIWKHHDDVKNRTKRHTRGACVVQCFFIIQTQCFAMMGTERSTCDTVPRHISMYTVFYDPGIVLLIHIRCKVTGVLLNSQ